MPDFRANWRMLRYLARHKCFVLRAGQRTRAPLWRLLVHDLSKLSRHEWPYYAKQFFGRDRPGLSEDDLEHIHRAYQRAWLHHQHASPHHWQHWVTHHDAGTLTILPMPPSLVREMVADWMGAHRCETGLWDVTEWYQLRRYTILLAPSTQDQVEYLLATVKMP